MSEARVRDVGRVRRVVTTQELPLAFAERTALGDLLDRLPASSMIQRRGLEFRKLKVDETLACAPVPPGSDQGLGRGR